MVYHSNQLCEAVVKLWQRGYSFWSPTSPDLNVMDFAIWGILARKACEKPLSNVESLKRSLKKAWADLDEETIRNCCATAHKRLEAVVEAEGGYIEKKIDFL